MVGTIDLQLSATPQTNGTNVTTGNSNFSALLIGSPATLQFQSADAMGEAVGIRFAQNGGAATVNAYMEYGTPQATATLRLPFTMPSLPPSASPTWIRCHPSAADHATNLGSFAMMPSGRVNWFETGGQNISSDPANPMVPGNQYICQLLLQSGTLTLKVFPKGSLTALFTLAPSVGFTTIGSWRMGIGTASSWAQWSTNSGAAIGHGDYLARTDAILPTNAAPTATITTGTPSTAVQNATVPLRGTATDSDGTVVSTAWSWDSYPDALAGPGPTINNPGSLTSASFVPLIAGTYVARLIATDNGGASSVAALKSITITGVTATPSGDARLVWNGTNWLSATSGVVSSPPSATVPSAPTAPSVLAGNGSVVVSWTSPATGGSAITGYDVQPFIGSTGQTVVSVGNVTLVTISGLTNGTAYTFKVRAKNAVGNGPYSVASASATPASAGSTTSNIYTTQTPVTTDASDGQAITVGIVFTSASSGTISGIRMYRATTAPSTAVGLLFDDAGTELARATFGTLTAGWNQVTFTTPVTVTAGTTYRAAYSTNGPYVASNDLFSIVNAPLTATRGCYAYASNAFPSNLTYGAYFADVLFTAATASVPSAPSAPTGVVGNFSVTLTWAAPANGGASITGYDIQQFVGGVGGAVKSVGNTLSTTVSQLSNGTAYTFKVRAKNSVGNGAYSAASSAYTPSAVDGTLTHGSQINTSNVGVNQYFDTGLGRKLLNSDLTVYNSEVLLSSIASAGGTVSKAWFKAGLLMDVAGVTFVGCRFDHGQGGFYNGTNYPFTMRWCSIDAATPNASGIAGIYYSQYTAYRCYIAGEMDGAKANGGVTLTECLIRTTASAPDDHNDGVQATGSDSGNLVERCNIDCRPVSGIGGPNAALFTADNSSGLHVWYDNYLMGGGYVIRTYENATYDVQGNWVVTSTYLFGPADRKVIPQSNVTWGTIRANIEVNDSNVQTSVIPIP